MTTTQIIHASPCVKCSNEFYRVLGPKVEAGQVTIQQPVCTKCETPISTPVGSAAIGSGGTGK